jgi:hypothetical protein
MCKINICRQEKKKVLMSAIEDVEMFLWKGELSDNDKGFVL